MNVVFKCFYDYFFFDKKKINVLNFDLFFIRKKMLMIEKLIMNNFCL